MESDLPKETIAKIEARLRDNSVILPAGQYLMGGNRLETEQPVHEVAVDSIAITKYLITKQQYCDFLNSLHFENYSDGMYFFLNTLNKMSRIVVVENKYVPVSGFEEHPVVCVSWIGAYAFALFVGGRLPFEAEWEKASRGNLTSSLFPWGNNKPTQDLANFGENVGCTTRVGSYPPNSVGLYEISGNVWEWCCDWYSQDYYLHSPTNNPKGPKKGVDKVIRGGSWAYGEHDLRCAARRKRWSRVGGTNVGFRVVFDVGVGNSMQLMKLRIHELCSHLSPNKAKELRKEFSRFKR